MTTTPITLSRLYTFPVKSMKGIRQSQSHAGETGLGFDRNFMITDETGKFITARRYPQMVLFTPVLLSNGIYLRSPEGSGATILFEDFRPDHLPCEVWGNHFTSLLAPEKINQWLCQFFDIPVQLRWLSPQSTRRVKKFPDTAVSFADCYPYLVVNEASFREVQRRCGAGIKIEQFRSNIIVTGAEPFAEDRWKTIQVGDVVFDLKKPCSRCILTTVSTDKGIKHPEMEPFHTLQTFRKAADNDDVDFGMNAIARNSGVIQVGDTVTVLETREPRQYEEQIVEKVQAAPAQPEAALELTFNGKLYPVNNQHVLLEQLEGHQVNIPYSCRAGVCGCCKVTLVSGEVTPLKAGAIKENGDILACSCIPKTNITIRHA
ncbi:MOSC domain-containing protein [Morganella morganii]|nr:MOSC domain-containing protein [Morganella morganii]